MANVNKDNDESVTSMFCIKKIALSPILNETEIQFGFI